MHAKVRESWGDVISYSMRDYNVHIQNMSLYIITYWIVQILRQNFETFWHTGRRWKYRCFKIPQNKSSTSNKNNCTTENTHPHPKSLFKWPAPKHVNLDKKSTNAQVLAWTYYKQVNKLMALTNHILLYKIERHVVTIGSHESRVFFQALILRSSFLLQWGKASCIIYCKCIWVCINIYFAD